MRNARPKRIIATRLLKGNERFLLRVKGLGLFNMPSWDERKKAVAKRVSIIENRRREPRILREQAKSI